MGIEEYIRALALANRYGWAFLAAYGMTWLLCAWAWLRMSPRIAAYTTLFQGAVALPVALALTALTPGQPRPNLAVLDSLSVVLAMGQVLGLPVVILLVISGRHTLVPLGMVTILGARDRVSVGASLDCDRGSRRCGVQRAFRRAAGRGGRATGGAAH